MLQLYCQNWVIYNTFIKLSIDTQYSCLRYDKSFKSSRTQSYGQITLCSSFKIPSILSSYPIQWSATRMLLIYFVLLPPCTLLLLKFCEKMQFLLPITLLPLPTIMFLLPIIALFEPLRTLSQPSSSLLSSLSCSYTSSVAALMSAELSSLVPQVFSRVYSHRLRATQALTRVILGTGRSGIQTSAGEEKWASKRMSMRVVGAISWGECMFLLVFENIYVQDGRCKCISILFDKVTNVLLSLNCFKLIVMHEQSWLAPKESAWIIKNNNFLKAHIESINGDVVICILEDGSYAQAKKDKVFQRDPAYNEFSSDKINLMDNDLINEPEILKTLRLRLSNMKIYTFVENSIISVNPYYNIPMYYVDQVKKFYCENLIDLEQNSRDVNLYQGQFEPHIYSITAQMLGNVRKTKRDQAVIISGQSGAGKTEANKQCLKFLQYYFHREGSVLNKKIDSILTLSNPILQAFGNSKTIRNNNSSRFGKFLSIWVNNRLQVKRVKIFNYLLEKSRIINRADNQQNFHIFYELLRGLSKTEKTNYYLSTQEYEYKMEDFVYLKSKNQLKYESHADISFQKVKLSLSTLQKPDAFDFVCRVLSAILLLGNLQLYESQNQDCCRISNQAVFGQICELLRISRNALNSALTCYQIKIGSDMLTKYFNGREVQQLINSLAKILYQKLFQWIINEINSISCYEGNEQLNNLGFLDIYGFEILESNSLQQLFINYTNQRLHQIYLTKIFKQEEELFKAEGLTHMFKTIPYEDNMSVLQLIDFEQLSIFNLLDQWCQVASPDDSSFITKVRHKHKKHSKFPIQNFNLPSTMFLIKHSPKDIEYTVLGFRDKNKDLVRDEIKVALRSSQISHLKLLFTESTQSGEVVNKNNHKLRKFLSSKFRHEINSLITDLLGKSELHFIRCIKSNSSKKALSMEDEVAYNQICYLGILDTIKLKKLGYCVKHSYEAIDAKFKWLVRFYYTLEAFPQEINQSLKEFLPQFGQQQMLFGKTKVFFRDYAYSALVRKYRLYMQNMNKNTSKIQKAITSFIFRAKLANNKNFGKVIKKYMKTFLLQKQYQKTVSCLVKLQRQMKIKLHRLRKQKLQKNLYTLQAYIKKEICRRHKQKVFNAVQKILSLFRRYRLRKSIQKWSIINKIKNLLVEKAWKKIVISQKNTLQKYLLSFLTQVQSRNLISLAILNSKKKEESRSVKVMIRYIKSYATAKNYCNYMRTLQKTQRFFRTFIYRSKYLKLKKAAIVIQRAYREYYFNKNTARELFEINFGEEKYTLQDQNQSMRSFLYQNSLQNTLRILFLKFLDKFKEKCSLFYIIIDFQALINLGLCYPDNSWLQNYFQVVKESLEKDNPIQSVEVGQSFTVAATTNKLYLWGMNAEYNSFENMIMIKPQNQQRIEKIEVKDNRLFIYYDDRKDKQLEKECATITKNFHIENGKLFETKSSVMKLIKSPHINERVVEIACGASHTIIRTSLKKVYTFGTGKQGQLGQGNLQSIEQPKLLEFPDIKNYCPMQVSASINSSVILLSNRKIYWCGSNGSIDKIKVPVVFDLSTRFEQFSKGMFAPLRVKCSWSRSLSIIGVTLISFNGKLSNNIGLRNKVYELMVNKWQQSDFDSINPPFNPSFSDYLEECHVKMPKSKQSIEPQSKRVFKKLQEKISSIQTDKYNDISFSDPNFR